MIQEMTASDGTLTDSCVVDKGFGKDRVKMVGSDSAQQHFIREVIVCHLYWSCIYVIKDDEIFPEMITKRISEKENILNIEKLYL